MRVEDMNSFDRFFEGYWYFFGQGIKGTVYFFAMILIWPFVVLGVFFDLIFNK